MVAHRSLQQMIQTALKEPQLVSALREHDQQRAKWHTQLGLPLRRSLLHGPRWPTRTLTTSSGSLPVSNCDNVLYSTVVQVGGQSFPALLDSGSSDFWVTSSSLAPKTGYDPSKSDTYQPVDAAQSDFEITYLDGTKIVGTHGYETVKLGNVEVEHQVFAQATGMYNNTNRCDETALLGLGFGEVSSHNFPALLSNLRTVLDHPVFSLYLNEHNDYELFMNHTLGVEEPILGKPPLSSTSELTFGGVNATRYTGCLKWHSLGQFRTKGETFKGYWDFGLDKVTVGGTEIQTSKLAMIDSGSSIMAGSSESVGHIAQMLGMLCFAAVDGPDGVEEVECDSPFGFDFAATVCETRLEPLILYADGVPYELDTNDMLREIDTEGGSICMLDMIGVPGFPGWLLGTNFMRKYYTVFDFGNNRLGFAEASSYDDSICDADAYLNVNREPDKSVATLAPTQTPHTQEPSKPTNKIASTTEPPSPLENNNDNSLSNLGIFAGVLVVAVALAVWLGKRRRPRSYQYATTGNEIKMCDSEDTESTETSDFELTGLS